MAPYRRGSVWYVEISAALSPTGRRQRISTEARTELEADLLEAEMRVAADRARKGLPAGNRNPSKLTLKQAAERSLERLRGRGGYDQLRHTTNKHIVRSGLGELLLENITPVMIEDYLKKKSGVGPSTQNRIRAAISGAYSTVKRLQLFFGDNPIEFTEHRQEPEHIDRMVDPDDIAKLLKNAPGKEWRLVFALAAFAGLRRSEIRRLDLNEHVDLKRRVMHVVRSKTGVARRVGIHLYLVPLLKDAQKTGVELGDHTWQHSAEQVQKALGSDDDFHGLRHTWASQLIDCGARESVVEFMGWGRRKSSTFRKHYLDFPDARLRAEIDKLVYPGISSAGSGGSSRSNPTARNGHTPQKRGAR
jgi:integrase